MECELDPSFAEISYLVFEVLISLMGKKGEAHFSIKLETKCITHNNNLLHKIRA